MDVTTMCWSVNTSLIGQDSGPHLSNSLKHVNLKITINRKLPDRALTKEAIFALQFVYNHKFYGAFYCFPNLHKIGYSNRII